MKILIYAILGLSCVPPATDAFAAEEGSPIPRILGGPLDGQTDPSETDSIFMSSEEGEVCISLRVTGKSSEIRLFVGELMSAPMKFGDSIVMCDRTNNVLVQCGDSTCNYHYRVIEGR